MRCSRADHTGGACRSTSRTQSRRVYDVLQNRMVVSGRRASELRHAIILNLCYAATVQGYLTTAMQLEADKLSAAARVHAQVRPPLERNISSEQKWEEDGCRRQLSQSQRRLSSETRPLKQVPLQDQHEASSCGGYARVMQARSKHCSLHLCATNVFTSSARTTHHKGVHRPSQLVAVRCRSRRCRVRRAVPAQVVPFASPRKAASPSSSSSSQSAAAAGASASRPA